jgi:hypothetical protein
MRLSRLRENVSSRKPVETEICAWYTTCQSTIPASV